MCISRRGRWIWDEEAKGDGSEEAGRGRSEKLCIKGLFLEPTSRSIFSCAHKRRLPSARPPFIPTRPHFFSPAIPPQNHQPFIANNSSGVKLTHTSSPPSISNAFLANDLNPGKLAL